MNSPSNEPVPAPKTSPELPAQETKPDSSPLTDEAMAAQQEQYRQAYLQQLRRMSCPGCGDDGILPL
jgi:hypothetical protein